MAANFSSDCANLSAKNTCGAALTPNTVLCAFLAHTCAPAGASAANMTNKFEDIAKEKEAEAQRKRDDAAAARKKFDADRAAAEAERIAAQRTKDQAADQAAAETAAQDQAEQEEHEREAALAAEEQVCTCKGARVAGSVWTRKMGVGGGAEGEGEGERREERGARQGCESPKRTFFGPRPMRLHLAHSPAAATCAVCSTCFVVGDDVLPAAAAVANVAACWPAGVARGFCSR